MKLKPQEISTRLAINELTEIRNYAHFIGDKALDIELSDFVFDDENRNRLNDVVANCEVDMNKRKSFEFFANKIKKLTGEKPILTFHRWTRTGKPMLLFTQKGWKSKWRVYYTEKIW